MCIVQYKLQKVGSLYSFLMYNKSWKFIMFIFSEKKMQWSSWADVYFQKRRAKEKGQTTVAQFGAPQQNTQDNKTSLHNWVGHPLKSLSISGELGRQNLVAAPRCQEMMGSTEGQS